jgi:hypothetical protein
MMKYILPILAIAFVQSIFAQNSFTAIIKEPSRKEFLIGVTVMLKPIVQD